MIWGWLRLKESCFEDLDKEKFWKLVIEEEREMLRV
jgi:hypothetical protein